MGIVLWDCRGTFWTGMLNGAGKLSKASAMNRIYLPYILGSDSPISYLYQNIAAKLDPACFSVTVLRNQQNPLLDAPNVTELYGFDRSATLKYPAHARAALRGHDLIHTGGYPRLRYVLARLTRLRNPGIKQVHSLRVDVDPDGPYQTAYKQKLVDIADTVTAVSEHTAATAREHLGVSPKVVYNGVDTDLFRPEYERPELFDKLGIDRPVLLYVGSFQRRKRPRALLEVARHTDEFAVLMIGNGTLHEEISTAARDLDTLYTPGRLAKHRLPAVYANSAGFVFPSVKEGCPNVVLEAMAAALPVVGYRATSMPELIKDGARGYLVEPDATTALCDAVDRLADEQLRRELGQRGREYVEANHTFETIVGQYQSIYETLLE